MLESLSMDGHLQAAVRHLRTLRDEIDAMLGRLGAFTQQAPAAAPPKQPPPPAEILNERVLEIMLTEGVISTPPHPGGHVEGAHRPCNQPVEVPRRRGGVLVRRPFLQTAVGRRFHDLVVDCFRSDGHDQVEECIHGFGRLGCGG